MNVADFLLERGQDGHVALVADSNEYTFLDLKRAAAGLAREILQTGARPGDAVGLLATNSLFWIAVYLATIKLGCVVVPLNPASMPAELLAVEFIYLRFKEFFLGKLGLIFIRIGFVQFDLRDDECDGLCIHVILCQVGFYFLFGQVPYNAVTFAIGHIRRTGNLT